MQTIKLNLIPGSVLPVVNVSQYDKSRQFALQVYEGAAAYSLTGKSVQIRGTKPDGNGFAYDSTDGVVSVSGNTATISTTQQMTAVGGQTMVELRITSGSTVLGTLNFVLDVEPSALSDDTPISDTDIPAIERDFQAALEEAEADALKAEGYAVGTQDGVPAQSGEPYYEDNAKYYKEQAEAAASGGGADALKAEGYAVGRQNGVPVTSESPYYHNNAEYYETRAGEQAYNASQSATAAGNSATAAAADSLEAEGWAVGEQGGTPVGPTSPYYHNNAKYYSEQTDVTSLASMSDVDLTSPTNNQVLKYDAATQKWVNGTGGGGADALDDLTDVTLTSPASGQALVYDGSKWVNDTVSGVPTGGTTNQVLAKNSNTDGDTKWMTVPLPAEIAAIENVYGAKNLLQVTMATQTTYGVTYTVNADGSISLSNTSTSGGEVTIGSVTLPPGTYTMTGAPSGGGAGKWRLKFGASILDDGNGVTFTLNSTTTANVNFAIGTGNDFTGKVIYPMIRDARIVDDTYVPYAETNAQLTTDKEKLDAYNYAMGKEYGITYASLPKTFSVPEGTGGRLLVSGRDSYVSIFYLSRISNTTQAIKNDQNFVVSHNGTSFTVSSVGTASGGSGTTFKLIGAPFTEQI